MANFSSNGNPNGTNLPKWDKTTKNNHKVLCFTLNETKMGKPSYFKLIKNMLTKGDPKAWNLIIDLN